MTDLRPYQPDSDRADCERIFASLPDWFGIPSAVEAYLSRMTEQTTFVAHDDEVIGFVSIIRHGERAAEIDVIAVSPTQHRQGLGRDLVLAAEDWCRKNEVDWLQAKTLDASRQSEEYALTRKFWFGVGFVPLQTFPELWDPANPALQMVKRVPTHTKQSLIETLELSPHPEGGYFRETWRSPAQVQSSAHGELRNASTCISFLLGATDESDWHKVTSDEIWLWQSGDPLLLTIRDDPFGEDQTTTLGPTASFQAVVPAGAWQKARPIAGVHGYSLVGCAVAPGFEFRDFTLGMADLREVRDDDLDTFFGFGREPRAVHQAAFTSPDPDDRAAFDQHWQRIRNHDGVLLRSIEVAGTLVGHIASFFRGDEREVTYWIGESFWGQGFATQALRAFLKLEDTRPLWARVAADNAASCSVLRKCGFKPVRDERGFAEARGEEIDEVVFRLVDG